VISSRIRLAAVALLAVLVTPAALHAAAPAELTLLPDDIPRQGGDLRSYRQLDLVMRAAVPRYPELISGPSREGIYRLDVALNADGTIYRSGLHFYPGIPTGIGRSSNPEIHRIIPTDASELHVGMPILRGERVGALGIAPNEIRVLFSILPADYDDTRSSWRVERAVRARHSDLAFSDGKGPIPVLTVLMTENGEIDREHVGRINSPEGLAAYPDFRVLGLDSLQIGSKGRLTLGPEPPDPDIPAQIVETDSQYSLTPYSLRPDRKEQLLLVRYAWPRRVGEPDAGTGPFVRPPASPSPPPYPSIASEMVGRHCPEAFQPSRELGDLCWIVLSHQGQVIRSGLYKQGEKRRYNPSLVRELNPDLKLGEVRRVTADNTAGDWFAQVLFAWTTRETP
jgi:hypothetical protein